MQIVIDFSDIKYQWIKDNPLTYDDEYCEAIRNGTPLPKGHGRIIDEDDIAIVYEQFYTPSDYYFVKNTISDAKTIIEADN